MIQLILLNCEYILYLQKFHFLKYWLCVGIILAVSYASNTCFLYFINSVQFKPHAKNPY